MSGLREGYKEPYRQPAGYIISLALRIRLRSLSPDNPLEEILAGIVT